MSLDQNLFTLNMLPCKDDPNVLDLVDPAGNAHYKKQRVQGSVYKINVFDPLSESLLATATAPSAASKQKTIELHNPSIIVELKYSGTIHFKWRFKWEEHEFEWRREECYILRKPDPAVLVAVTKEPPGRLRTSTVQLLDYNLNRFDIDDRKGLEIVILTALLTFQDTNDAYHTPEGTPPIVSTSTKPSAASTPISEVPTVPDLINSDNGPPPTVPPKPAPKAGVERMAEMHMLRTLQGEGEANEVEIGVEGSVSDFALYAEKLLQDDAMLFITLRSASAAQVPKVLQVVEQTKRLRHKAGLSESESLYQYVLYDASTRPMKGPKRINLDDPPAAAGKKGYAPPKSLTIHLSKIDMPELQPRVDSNANKAKENRESRMPSLPSLPSRPSMPSMPSLPSFSIGRNEDKGKDGKGKKDKEKNHKKDKEKDKKHDKIDSKPKKDSSIHPPAPNKLTRPSMSMPSTSSTPPHPTASHSHPSTYSAPPYPPPSPFGHAPDSSPFYSGGPSFPNAPPPPLPSNFPSATSQFGPPPTHPYHGGSASSFYGSAPGFNSIPPSGSSMYGGYNPGYL